MYFKKTQYYKDETALLKILGCAGSAICPHCNSKGTLILHGFLYGYTDELDSQKTITGRRIICNARRKHNAGCGRTLSILQSTRIKNFTVSAPALWLFLLNIFLLSKKEAFEHFKNKFSLSSCYRIWDRFKLCQSRIRTLLTRTSPTPEKSESSSATIQTILHLKNSFTGNPCPVTAFQEYFQVSFF
jgi:hypothetical protein